MPPVILLQDKDPGDDLLRSKADLFMDRLFDRGVDAYVHASHCLADSPLPIQDYDMVFTHPHFEFEGQTQGCCQMYIKKRVANGKQVYLYLRAGNNALYKSRGFESDGITFLNIPLGPDGLDLLVDVTLKHL